MGSITHSGPFIKSNFCPSNRYVNTAACISRISYIDGDKGILRYRGYPIEELAERSSYTEVCLLLDMRKTLCRACMRSEILAEGILEYLSHLIDAKIWKGLLFGRH